MAVYPIEFKWCLDESQKHLIDFFFIQWNTPKLLEEGTCKTISSDIKTEKEDILKRFIEWIVNYFDKIKPSRPLFIVTPELSMPKDTAAIITTLESQLSRPLVFIMGFEYLIWSKYEDLIKNSDMPNQEGWLQNANGAQFVNAAGIWIKEKDSPFKKYIQPKSKPFEDEPILLNNNYLVFTSGNQISGKRLNFCVQICSDFAYEKDVIEFRRALMAHGINTLDITFLLQCNEDQDADQFKNAVKAYFSPPNEMIATESGCLFFVNNANKLLGKSSTYGKSKVHIKHKNKWDLPLKSPQPTYFVKNNGPFDHQEIVFRERGPCIYSMTYKPVYLVNPIHGAGDSLPFHDGMARFMPIEKSTFGVKPNDKWFFPIYPTIYWLNNEWIEGHSELSAELKGSDIQEDVIKAYIGAYRDSITKWMEVIKDNEAIIRNAIKIFLSFWREEDKFPFKTPEPTEWHPDISLGMKRFLQTYSLLYLGIALLSKGSIKPDPHDIYHSRLLNETRATFLWGRKRRYAKGMIHEFYANLYNTRIEPYPKKHLLVLVDPSNRLDEKTIDSIMASLKIKITKPLPEESEPSGIKQGTVTDAESEDMYAPKVLFGDCLVDEIEKSETRDELRNNLSKCVEKCLNG